ncbi:MAG: TonB-dependent receptor TonB [Desulfobacterales bacterium]|nr:MAG: TonB-dependent receptor TonB [Desulfobacterales bacterium]
MQREVKWWNVLKVIMLAALLGAADMAHAMEEAPFYTVDDITVTGRKIEERLSGELEIYGHQVEVVEGETLEKSGFVDLQQALGALVPGLFISVSSGRGDYANMKLHGSGDILWLLDGVRLNNRLYGGAYLDSISIKSIDRIEILKGGEGLFYGTNAQAGVINIITRKVTDKISGQVGLAYGSHQYRDLYGDLSSTVKGNGFMLFGSYDGWDGYTAYDDWAYGRAGNPDKPERGYDRGMIGGKYERRFDLGEGAVFKVHVQRNMGSFDFPRINELMASNDRTEDIQFIKWDHDITESFSYYIKAFNHRWWTDYTRRKLDGSYLYNDSVWGYEDRGVNLMGSYRFMGKNEILFGYDYQNYWAKDDVWRIAKKKEDVNAFFFQYRPWFAFMPKARFAVGGRYNKTGGNEKATWNASMRSPLVANISARAMVGTSFALPTAEHLYLDEDSMQGNPDLKPEESLNVDIGLEGRFSIFRWGLGYYWRETADEISGNADWTTYINAEGKTKYQGFEVQLGVQATNEISFFTSLTTTDAKTDGSSNQLARTPEYIVKANLNYTEANGRWGASLESRYVGKTVVRGYSAYEPYQDEINYGDYFLADLSAFYAFGTDNRHRFTLRMENILDQDYATSINRFRGDDDKFTYERKGLPLSVVVGYSFSF